MQFIIMLMVLGICAKYWVAFKVLFACALVRVIVIPVLHRIYIRLWMQLPKDQREVIPRWRGNIYIIHKKRTKK